LRRLPRRGRGNRSYAKFLSDDDLQNA
jgi:hypothetical protein